MILTQPSYLWHLSVSSCLLLPPLRLQFLSRPQCDKSAFVKGEMESACNFLLTRFPLSADKAYSGFMRQDTDLFPLLRKKTRYILNLGSTEAH